MKLEIYKSKKEPQETPVYLALQQNKETKAIYLQVVDETGLVCSTILTILPRGVISLWPNVNYGVPVGFQLETGGYVKVEKS